MKVVNIIGMGPSAIHGFNGLGPTWGINHSYIYGKLDRVFIMHDFQHFLNEAMIAPRNKVDWYDGIIASEIVTNRPFCICSNANGDIVGSHYPEKVEKYGGKIMKMSTVFDLNATAELMGTIDIQETLGYAIAQAILDGYDMIMLWGVEVWCPYDKAIYGRQIQNVNDWCRVALCKGIRVVVPFQIIPKIMNKDC